MVFSDFTCPFPFQSCFKLQNSNVLGLPFPFFFLPILLANTLSPLGKGHEFSLISVTYGTGWGSLSFLPGCKLC